MKMLAINIVVLVLVGFIAIRLPPDLNRIALLNPITVSEHEKRNEIMVTIQPSRDSSSNLSIIKMDNVTGEPLTSHSYIEFAPSILGMVLPVSYTIKFYNQVNVIEYPNGENYALFWDRVGKIRNWFVQYHLEICSAILLIAVALRLLYKSNPKEPDDNEYGTGIGV